MPSFYLGGSRNLQAPSSAVFQVVSAIAKAQGSIHVGCCIGADALVIQSAVPSLPRSSLVVFAISSQSGQGSISLSSSLVSWAASQGCPVRWQAGGGQELPLQARLIRRSLAAAAGCSVAVFFQPGAGSLAVASQLPQSVPVFAFGECPAVIPGRSGQWVSGSFLGLPCWSWQSAQLGLF